MFLGLVSPLGDDRGDRACCLVTHRIEREVDRGCSSIGAIYFGLAADHCALRRLGDFRAEPIAIPVWPAPRYPQGSTDGFIACQPAYVECRSIYFYNGAI